MSGAFAEFARRQQNDRLQLRTYEAENSSCATEKQQIHKSGWEEMEQLRSELNPSNLEEFSIRLCMDQAEHHHMFLS